MMAETTKESKSDDNINNNPIEEPKPIDPEEQKLNEDLKNRLRKYIKKLDGMYILILIQCKLVYIGSKVTDHRTLWRSRGLCSAMDI